MSLYDCGIIVVYAKAWGPPWVFIIVVETKAWGPP